jgi:cation transport ATPase
MRSENPADIAPQKVEKSADLFFMSIIVIIALFIGVIWFFIGEAGREMVYMILAGLVTGSMSSLAFIIWRYLPED